MSDQELQTFLEQYTKDETVINLHLADMKDMENMMDDKFCCFGTYIKDARCMDCRDSLICAAETDERRERECEKCESKGISDAGQEA